MNPEEKKSLERAIDKRRRLFESLQRMETFINTMNEETAIEEVTVRLETLNETMTDFRKIEDKIMACPDQISEIIEFESRFFKAKVALKPQKNKCTANTTDMNEQIQLQNTVTQLAANQSTFLEAFTNVHKTSSDVRLPKIAIQSFGGQYDEFPAFKDLFESSIHNNQSISKVQKFQYLKGVLRDEAAALIRHIKCTSANYEEAWDKIVDRYDKKKQVVTQYIQLFLNIVPVTKPTQPNLRSLYNTADEVIRGLRALGTEAEGRDPWLINILLSKVDANTRQLWAQKTLHNDFPSFESCLKFIGEQCDTMENSESVSTMIGNKTPLLKQARIATHHAINSPGVKRIPKCECCEGSHPLYKCQQFKSMSIPDRRDFVLKYNICFNCLLLGHSAQSCKSHFLCHYCRGKHHSSLHLAATKVSSNQSEQPLIAAAATTLSACIQETTIDSSKTQTSQQQPSTLQIQTNFSSQLPDIQGTAQLNTVHNTVTEHLLPTAVVNIANIHGELQQCRILLDSGSMGNLISQSLVKKLQLPQRKSNTIVSGIASNTTSRWTSTVTLSSRIDPQLQLTIDAHILASLSTVPMQSFTKPHISQSDNLQLADPTFNKRSPVDLILNAGTVFSTLLPGTIKVPKTSVIGRNTIFGWVLVGDLAETKLKSANSLQLMHTSCVEIDKTLQRFWQLEEVSTSSKLSPSEKQCEEFYKQTTTRDPTGRYITRLPFNEVQQQLGNSVRSAVSRLLAIERKLEKNIELKQEYHSFMAEYLTLQHMEKIPANQIDMASEHFYLPHHFVIKTDSNTTKLRVVFDGSCRTSSGLSLNQKLLVGPTIQEELLLIMMRFRMHNIVFCADIEKMYRQVLLDTTDRDYQRIVWRFDTCADIEHYRLNTVTYGTASAPFLATRTIKQLSEDNKVTHPLASRIISRDFYVDDLLTGASNMQEALTLQQDIVTLLASGGFTLRKWSSNSSIFMDSIKQSDCERSIPIFKNEDDTIKVLGLHWQPESDTFVYKVKKYSQETLLTKRKFLSQASRLFDPFGWLAPVLIIIKILFQELWVYNLTWDDPLPTQFVEKWENIKLNLKCLENIEIPRQILFQRNDIQLHGFCDASEAASSAVIYCKSYDTNGHPQIRIVAAKTKVAPVRTISLPRLELNGALLLARLFSHVIQGFDDHNPEIFAWSDSEIVIAWLSSLPKRWKTYVANRTSEILETLPRKNWNHVRSIDNPADLASRGIQPADLITNEFWFSGPKWLMKNQIDWPTTTKEYKHINTDMDSRDLEQKKVVLQTTIQADESMESLFIRVSSWSKLIRVIAFCMRFIQNCQTSKLRKYDILTTIELQAAEMVIIKTAQRFSFSVEITELLKEQCIKGKSALSTLAPFLDSEGILRVGGRLGNSSAVYNSKHPIILHYSHILSKLIVSYYHKFFLHPCPSLLSSLLKNNYWIIGGSYLTKRESQSCVKCVRYRANTSKQLMGTLPQARVQQSRPFTHTGIDFAGPIMIQSKRGRGAKLHKSYICVFVCLSVKAVHLEVVSDLSSEAFIAAFKRFVSRRGLPVNVYTDNGTNFVGAHRKFSNIFTRAELRKNFQNIRLFCAERRINWHFSPPAAPHFGGIWEAAVKSMKTHLRIVTGQAKLTFEEMCTLVAQIECVLNSRPLYPQFSEDINSLEVITPGHFLTMGSLTAIPEVSYSDIPINRLTRWQQIQQQLNSFWVKYHKEYLNTLQQRNKWKAASKNIERGDLVIIKDNLPAAHWALARIIDVHPGNDGKVRVVTLKTRNATLKRSIHQLVKLPVNE